jgi:hypothetical protein
MANVLLDMPQPVARSILTEWLVVANVVSLDSAFTSKQLRPAYLNSAYLGELVYCVRSFKCNEFEKLVNWSILKGAKMDNLRLSASLLNNHELRQRFLRTSGASIRHVAFTANNVSSNSYLSIVDVEEWCPNVDEFEFHCKNQWMGDRTSVWDDAMSDFLASSTKLRSLTVDKVTFTTQELAHILANCSPSIAKLKLTKCIGSLPAQIAIPSLEELVIVHNEIPAATMHAISQNCRSLRTLRLFEKSTGDGLRDECVQAVLQGCTLLKGTDVEYAHGLGDELRVELVKRRDFTELSLSGTQIMADKRWSGTDAALAQGMSAVCPSLSALALFGGWVTDAVLKVCAQHCPLLRDVELVWSASITSEGVAALAHADSQLRKVRFDGCPLVGDSALAAIGQNCRNLHTIRLTNVSAITDGGIQALIRHGSGLRSINIAECGQLGDIALLSIAQTVRGSGRYRPHRA